MNEMSLLQQARWPTDSPIVEADLQGGNMLQDLRVNVERLKRDFDAVAEFGATGNGGVHRPALSETHLKAREWFRNQVGADCLTLRTDGAGNHSAILPAGDPVSRTLLLGSHLDSVPYGGRFDGALGVVTAYEVLRTVRDAEIQLPVHLEAIDFTDEEGTLVGLLGSRALAGTLSRDELANPRGGRQALTEGLARAGLSEASILTARRDPESLAGYLELHIEQGPRLTWAGADIGIVTSIVGIGSLKLVFVGQADHAGTTPIETRRDAGLGAAAFMVAAHNRVVQDFQECLINFGHISLEPGAHNIVPGLANIALEFRAPDNIRMQALQETLLDLARQYANQYRLDFRYEPQVWIEPTACSSDVQDAFVRASESLGLRQTKLSSGAGHDTMSLAQICPSGMIFIPSAGGSHSYRESVEWHACVDGANTILLAALDLALGIRMGAFVQ